MARVTSAIGHALRPPTRPPAGGTTGPDRPVALSRHAWALLTSHREFAGLWWSASVSTAGDQLGAVALAVLVYHRTGQPVLTALTYSISLWGPLAGTVVLGAIADQWPRRAVMIIGAGIQAAMVAATALPGVPLAVAAVLVLAALMVSTPYQAAADATIRVALSDNDYPVGVAVRTVGVEVGQLVGLGVAGWLVSALGAGPALLIDAGTFALAALLMTTGRSRPAADPRRSASRAVSTAPVGVTAEHADRPRWLAWSVIWSDPRLRALLAMRLLAGCAVVPEGVAIDLAAQLHAPWASGVLLMIEPAGVLIGTALLHAVASEPQRLRLLGPLAITSVAPLITLICGPRWALVVPALAIAGLAAAYHVPAAAYWGQIVPDHYRGRVHALARPLLRAVQGAGMAAGGALAGLAGSACLAIAAAGGVGVLCAIPIAVAWSRARHRVGGDYQSRLRMPFTSSRRERDGPL